MISVDGADVVLPGGRSAGGRHRQCATQRSLETAIGNRHRTPMAAPVNILHLHSTFDLGGKEARAVRLMNAFGDRAKHTIVSGVPDALSARDAIAQ
jgi:hypothetical protein